MKRSVLPLTASIFLSLFFLFVPASKTLAAAADVSPDQSENLPLTTGKARMVIYRKSRFKGAAGNALIVEIVDGQPVLLGYVHSGKKIRIDIEPGKHVFMITSKPGAGGDGDFLRAEFKAGSVYYASIDIAMWSGFRMFPVRADSWSSGDIPSDEKATMLDTKYVETNSKGYEYFEKKRESITSAYKNFWDKWQKKDSKEKADFTLNIDDGVIFTN